MRYFKIFLEQCKLSLMSAAIFRANFILMLIQSIINSLMSVLCVEFIYGSVDTIAGWNKNEMIILICTSLVVNQLFRGFVNPNQLRFVSGVSSGAFDKMLLKPINIIFQINTGTIDISSLLSAVAPLIIIFTQMSILNAKIEGLSIILYILFVTNGLIVLTSFMLLLYSLSFLFIKIDGLNNIYYMMMSISEKPKEIFSNNGIVGSFIFIVPAIPLANAPASILLNKGDVWYILLNLCAGVIFLFCSIFFIKMGIKKYGSASS